MHLEAVQAAKFTTLSYFFNAMMSL